jgi:Xaa-Pro aminopeptidase
MSPPRDRRLEADAPFVFSFELIGPSGHWIELCRMISFGATSDAVAEAVDVGVAAVEAGRRAMVPGGNSRAVHQAAAGELERSSLRLSPWSGHSIGMDVIEPPVIAAPEEAQGGPIDEGTVLAFHPLLTRSDDAAFFYMADTFLVEANGGRPLSRWPMQLYRLQGRG